MTYTFGLFDSHNQQIDVTNIDENSLDLAMDLFMQFAPSEGYCISELSGHYVTLIEEVEEDDDDR